MNRQKSCRGAISLSLGFYLGMGILLLIVIAGVLASPSTRALVDQHANPKPATQPPAQVLVSSGSNLYHGGSSCPYTHRDSKFISLSEAVAKGLVPCAYCIGNSAAKLTPTVVAPRQVSRR